MFPCSSLMLYTLPWVDNKSSVIAISFKLILISDLIFSQVIHQHVEIAKVNKSIKFLYFKLVQLRVIYFEVSKTNFIHETGAESKRGLLLETEA